MAERYLDCPKCGTTFGLEETEIPECGIICPKCKGDLKGVLQVGSYTKPRSSITTVGELRAALDPFGDDAELVVRENNQYELIEILIKQDHVVMVIEEF